MNCTRTSRVAGGLHRPSTLSSTRLPDLLTTATAASELPLHLNKRIHRHQVAVEIRRDPVRRQCPSCHSKRGIAGTVMGGDGHGALLEAVPELLRSPIALVIAPLLAGAAGFALPCRFPGPPSPCH